MDDRIQQLKDNLDAANRLVAQKEAELSEARARLRAAFDEIDEYLESEAS